MEETPPVLPSAMRQHRVGWFVFPVALLFYGLTLARGVLWGDGGYLQRNAALGLLDRDGAGRALWFAAARLMLHLPVGTPAVRVNLLSALAGALTVLFVYRGGLAAGLSHRGAVVAAAALAVSHTFWQQAVRAEVYAPFMALLALQVWLWFKWRPGQTVPVLVAVGLWGPTLLAHQMAVLIAPALLLLCVLRPRWLRPGQWALVALTGVAGAAATLLVLDWQTGAPPARALLLYLTHAGIDFGPALFAFSWSTLPKDALLAAAFLILQYPGLALLLGFTGLSAVLRQAKLHPAWAALLVLGLTDFLFAFAYRVNDRYVFFLPLYLVFALAAGRGWDEVQRRWPRVRRNQTWALVLALLVLTPVVAYASAAALVQRLHVNPLQVRVLPGRDPGWYFLWPASNRSDDADSFARASLAAVPPGAAILADYTPYSPLSYVQTVEGVRADVQLVRVEASDDLSVVLARLSPGTQVFLADDDPRYYNLASLHGATVEPFGNLYYLIQ